MYSKRNEDIIRNRERNNFAILKEKENYGRKFIDSDDILYTNSFHLEKYSNSGDSGDLLLATNKLNSDKKYILKHEYYDCACNEYMYSKIGNKLGINITPVKLFFINDKKNNFKSDFVCGIKYFENANKIGYNNIIKDKENIKNWHDYFRFKGMESLFFESDGIEVLKDKDYIYRIDTTSSFTISNFDISYLAYDYEYEGINIKQFTEKKILEKAKFDTNRRINKWKFDKSFFVEHYGMEYFYGY